MSQTHPSIDQLVDYQHGELSAHDDATVHAHLADCPACAQTHGEELALSEMLRTSARSRERELPAGLIARIHRAIDDEEPSAPWWQRLGAAFRPAFALPLAAAIAIALYFGVSAWRGNSGSAIDPAYYLENHAALATTTPFGEESVLPTAFTADDAAADEQAVDEAR